MSLGFLDVSEVPEGRLMVVFGHIFTEQASCTVVPLLAKINR
ncbi:MAG: hypothetical protein U0586_09860 [Candidatus Brocadiaceae bacterium]